MSKTQTAQEKAEELIRTAGKRWPSTVVARNQIEKFTGGIYTARTMINKDYKGEGPRGSFHLGRQVVYPVDSLCDWLIAKIAVREQN